MQYKAQILSGLLGCLIGLSLSQCKTLPDDSQLQGVLEEDDFERVNEPASRALIRSDAKSWNTYKNDQYGGVTNEAYEKNWSIYQNFLLGNPSKPLTVKCVRHTVHFVFEPKQVTQEEQVVDAAKPLDDKQVQTCSEANNPSARVLSYQLFNYRQPNLTRNFLSLAKAGFFNGKPISLWKNFNILPIVGERTADQDPFFIAPDDKYTQPTPQQSLKEIYTDKEDPTTSPLFNESQYFDKLTKITSERALLAIISNNLSNPHDSSRKALPFRIAFSRIISASQEVGAGFSKNKTFPVPFGELTIDSQFGKRSLLSTRDLMELNSKTPLQLSCVAIEYSVDDYIEDDHICPEVIGK